MAVKQLTEIENGRLKPSTAALDADIIEVSKEQGNALEVKGTLKVGSKETQYGIHYAPES